MSNIEYKVWECIVCGVIYNEKLGWPEEGLAPGTRWDQVPEDWLCPDCGVGKDDFEMVEISLQQPSGMPGATPLPISKDTVTDAPVAPTIDAAQAAGAGVVYRQWECVVCGIVYDEAHGWPDDGIAPGTHWEDVPEDWLCPDCGVGKSDFEMLEVGHTVSVVPSTASMVAAEDSVSVAGAVSTVDDSLSPIVIVGTGLAGYNLARELRKHDRVTPIAMITADDGDFYSKPQLSTGFAKNKSAAELVTSSAEKMARDLDVRIHIYSRVTAIDVDRHEIEFAGRSLQYSKLVLAAGAECIRAPLKGDAASQVYQINDLADYARFRTAAIGCRKVLVIGAGLIGSEYANDLLQAGLEVDVVDPMSTPLASLLPADAGKALQLELANAGATFHFGTVVETLESKGQGVIATLKNGTQIEADLVLSAIGVRARLELAELAGVATERGILVDRTLKTSAEDVYAIGDCAQVEQHLLYYIAPLMVGARALAKTLTGEATQVRYGVMPVTVKTTLCPVTVSPPPRDAEGEWEIEHLDETSVKAEFLSPQGELLGFALTGKAAVSHKELLIASVPDVMA